MNRTTSEASKVLGVDASQVKRWASMFKDYLSPAANPSANLHQTRTLATLRETLPPKLLSGDSSVAEEAAVR